MLKIVYSVFLLIHGFAHLVGFLVNWKIIKDKEVTYKTTIFDGKIDIGDLGTRVLGLIWLLVGVYFGYIGYKSFTNPLLLSEIALYLGILSFGLSFSGWPDAKFGVVVNIILISFLILIKFSILSF